MEYSFAFPITHALGVGTFFVPRGKLLHQGQATRKLAAVVAILTARRGKGTSTATGCTPAITQEQGSLAISLKAQTRPLLGQL